MHQTLLEQITKLVEPLVSSMGLQLWGIRLNLSSREHGLVQIFVDSDEGVSADQCGELIDMISPALDVEDLISGAYNLEVSSPGMDRLLFTLEQARQYVGQEVRAQLQLPVESRKRITGLLEQVSDTDDMLTIREEERSYTLSFANIQSLRVVPTFPQKGAKSPKSAS
ncbi:MAG: ribosome maturation factor RimP [Succinivibrio sp.]|nr:ribosome maturation factor RimP [Succinivibrio sp.]